ncbi:MAG TPA: bifunctional [glutamine synthetase] adenylyltransferase/[glutamine synthetase]-adenylyl-L-tyrosine phosphorylase [Rhizomicrobium sp.]|nr:bifunctional [glutamine synthetase] adenylyltransferase/[glutamine synthetase]-adenylyl-L-tyrosine phosphorylase [Rhizomicrobium sp.]
MADLPSSSVPAPFDPARAARTRAALAEGPDGFAPPPDAARLLDAMAGNSPYLARLAVRERSFLRQAMESGPDAALESLLAAVPEAAFASGEGAVAAALRIAKRRAALAIAMADVGGLWDLDSVTDALTRFADAAVGTALRFLLRNAAAQAGTDGGDPARLEAGTGLVVLAMGKYGAFELNYSSDIDLVVFYDAARFPFRKKDDARGAAVDIVKGLVKLLSETTADGYVFRTDLRLRPDAGVTQVAISTEAAEAYYEGMGQNWERAAMIKARVCAGDRQAGAAFLKAIEPFVWRRSLDYAAIEDIHSIKRQIHAHGGHGAIAVPGHNVKLGRGGIREIEFFAQTQQLILGGRFPELRPRRTLDAIEALRRRGHVSGEAAIDLSRAYRDLRKLEHRLQMIEDEQTHTLPKSPEGLAHVACFMGYADVPAFAIELARTLKTVQGHYVRLFEQSAPLSAARGSLVFTGVEEDPETLATLGGLGFRDAKHVSAAIRGWHHGRIRATRSARAREILTKLMPVLLEALAATADPDAAFAQFDRFVTRLPAGVQLFSLFLANPHLLKRVASVCGSAPRLADHLARAPGVLDALLDPDFLGELPSRAELDRQLADQFARAPDFESVLDAARRFAREQVFRVGVQIVEGTVAAEQAGIAFAAIAESVIAGLLGAVEGQLAAVSGAVPGGAFAVIAMGKLGGKEMTAASDLDLIFVYDTPAGIESSDGPKPLPASVYYGRLAQRLIAALTVPTAQGVLYEVDMRLRPTGNKGPVAVSLETFARYHATESWTWERMALTRARVITGADALRPRIEAAIRGALTSAPDVAKLTADARDMRRKIAAQFPGRSPWDLKYAPGGLVDIEFVAQTLQLRAAHARAEVLDPNTVAALEKLGRSGALSATDAEALLAAARVENALTQVLRIAVDGTLDPSDASPGLRALLVRAAGAKDFAGLERTLTDARKRAGEIFGRIVR